MTWNSDDDVSSQCSEADAGDKRHAADSGESLYRYDHRIRVSPDPLRERNSENRRAEPDTPPLFQGNDWNAGGKGMKTGDRRDFLFFLQKIRFYKQN